jgi:hypothetical protein
MRSYPQTQHLVWAALEGFYASRRLLKLPLSLVVLWLMMLIILAGVVHAKGAHWIDGLEVAELLCVPYGRTNSARER